VKYKDDDSVLLVEDEEGLIVTKKFTDEDWKKVDEMIENHPLFSKKAGNVEDNELLQALQAIKYDESAEKILEQLYKEANTLMKDKLIGQSDKKKFFLTKCLNVYADALAQEAQCIQTRAKILSNRALLHLWVKNYRKCVEDCLEAMKLDPNFVRPYARAAEALLNLGNYEKCIQMADKGLHIEFIKELKDVREEAIKKYDEEQEKLKIKQTKKKKPTMRSSVNVLRTKLYLETPRTSRYLKFTIEDCLWRKIDSFSLWFSSILSLASLTMSKETRQTKPLLEPFGKFSRQAFLGTKKAFTRMPASLFSLLSSTAALRL